jgi:hypothetical protein
MEPTDAETQYDRLLQEHLREFSTEWPARLLHVATMKSVVREPGNVYSGQTQPRYNILTYTWGRWPNPGGPSLAVTGIAWKIPPVQEERFSVQQFEEVIREIARGVEFVWVDVACIHQEDKIQIAVEVGKQAGIFRNAYKAFIWLNEYPESELTTYADIIHHHEISLRTMIKADDPWRRPAGAEAWQKRIRTRLSLLSMALEAVLSDPWFSSLWTLQEAVLRRDAFILSREGRSVCIPGLGQWQFTRLANTCSTLYDDLEILLRLGTLQPQAQDRLSPELALIRAEAAAILSAEVETMALLRRLIRKASLDFPWTNNPNVAYSAGHFRTATYNLDRIYGIMQIYGINCEPLNSTEGTADTDLEDLEDQFGQRLVALSPLLSQLFVHEGGMRPRRSWLITQKCHVPVFLRKYHSKVKARDSHLCQMVLNNSKCLRFTGKAWHFLEFLKSVTLGEAISMNDFRTTLTKIGSCRGHQGLDKIAAESLPLSPLTQEDMQILPLSKYQEEKYSGTAVIQSIPGVIHGDTLWRVISPWLIRPKTVIVLDEHQEVKICGSSAQSKSTVPDLSMPELSLPSLMTGIQVLRAFGETNVRVLLLGQFNSGSLYSNVGLILHAIVTDCGKVDHWERLGVVAWRSEPDWYGLIKGPPVPPLPMWHDFEGLME